MPSEHAMNREATDANALPRRGADPTEVDRDVASRLLPVAEELARWAVTMMFSNCKDGSAWKLYGKRLTKRFAAALDASGVVDAKEVKELRRALDCGGGPSGCMNMRLQCASCLANDNADFREQIQQYRELVRRMTFRFECQKAEVAALREQVRELEAGQTA